MPTPPARDQAETDGISESEYPMKSVLNALSHLVLPVLTVAIIVAGAYVVLLPELHR